MKFTKLACLTLVLGTVLLFTGVEMVLGGENDKVMLPRLIDFQAATDSIGNPLRVDILSVEKEFRSVSPGMGKFYYNKEIPMIIVPAKGWLRELLRVSQVFFRQENVKWHAESWDCDNYSMFVSAGVTLKLWDAGYTNSRCGLGWMVVDGKHEWAGIGPGRHALVFAVTSEGIKVIEPQTGMMTALDSYPNKEYIVKAVLL